MKQFSLAILLIVALLVAWTILAPDSSTDADLSSGTRAKEAEKVEAELAGAAETPATLSEQEASESNRVESSLPKEGDWVIRGQVHWARSDDPIAGQRVRCRFHPDADRSGAASFEQVVETDANGAFHCTMPAPTQIGELRAYAMTGSRAETEEERARVGGGDRRTLQAGDAAPQDLKLAVYHLDFPVRGKVTGPDGAAIEGATVQTGWSVAKTDREGNYEVFSLREHNSAQLFAYAPGFTHIEKMVDDIEGDELILDFQLSKAATISGVVRDELGTPIEGAEVSVFGMQKYSVLTDVQGEYLFDHVDMTKDRVSMIVFKEGYLEGRQSVSPDLRAEIEQDFVLVQGVTVRGVVVDESGQPVVGASLYIGFASSADNRTDARSDENGKFEFTQVPFGEQKLVTQAEGFAADRKRMQFDEGAPDPDPIRVELVRGRTISGLVVDRSGSPIAGVHMSPRHFGQYIQGRVVTDEAGRFEVENLPMTELVLEFYGERVDRERIEVEDHASDALRVELGRMLYLAGKVVDASTQLPITNFSVALTAVDVTGDEKRMTSYAGDWFPMKPFQSESGEWVYDEASEGIVTGAKIVAPGYATYFVPRIVASAAPQPDAAIAALEPEHLFRGVVLGGDPLAPIAGAAVSVDPRRTYGRQDYFSDPQRWKPAVTDAEGRFTVSGLSAAEDYRLRVAAVGFAQFTEAPLEFSQTATETARQIELSRGATIRGQALQPDGSPIAGSAVHMVPERSNSQERNRAAGVVTDAEGRFEISGIEAGRFWIQLQSNSNLGRDNHLTRIIGVSEDELIELILQANGSVSLAGSLRYPDGLPTRARVRLIPSRYRAAEGAGDEMIAQTTYAEDGQFRFEGVAAGEYTLRSTFSALNDGKYIALQAHVVVGEEDQLDLVLEPEE